MKSFLTQLTLGTLLIVPMLVSLVIPAFFVPTSDTSQVVGTQIAYAGGGLVTCDRCKFQDAIKTAEGLVKWIIQIGAVIGAVMFAYAGFLYMTAQGDTGKIGKAHAIFLSVIVGLVVMLAAWLLIELVVNTLVKDGEEVRSVFQ